MKKAAQTLLKKSRRHSIRPDDRGEVDYSGCQNEQVISELKKNDSLVKLTLMQADLEFEYPQKLEKMRILIRSY